MYVCWHAHFVHISAGICRGHIPVELQVHEGLGSCSGCCKLSWGLLS